MLVDSYKRSDAFNWEQFYNFDVDISMVTTNYSTTVLVNGNDYGVVVPTGLKFIKVDYSNLIMTCRAHGGSQPMALYGSGLTLYTWTSGYYTTITLPTITTVCIPVIENQGSIIYASNNANIITNLLAINGPESDFTCKGNIALYWG